MNSGSSVSNTFGGLHIAVLCDSEKMRDELKPLIANNGAVYDETANESTIVCVCVGATSATSPAGCVKVNQEWLRDSITTGRAMPYLDYPTGLSSVVAFCSKSIDPDLVKQLAQHGAHVVSEPSADVTHAVVKSTEEMESIKRNSFMANPSYVSANWIKDSIARNYPISQEKELIYRVYPEHGIPAMQAFTITQTNFSGQDRVAIQRMIELVGATYTGSLDPTKITHLIANYPGGAKWDTAIQLEKHNTHKVKVVCSDWLLACLKKWQYIPEFKGHLEPAAPVSPAAAASAAADSSRINTGLMSSVAFNPVSSAAAPPPAPSPAAASRTLAATAAAASATGRSALHGDEPEQQQAAPTATKRTFLQKDFDENRDDDTNTSKRARAGKEVAPLPAKDAAKSAGAGKGASGTKDTVPMILFSGSSEEQRQYIKRMLSAGVVARFCDVSHGFVDITATHFVTSELKRTEKLIGSLAAGIWVLKPSFIDACERAGKLVSELPHEYHGSSQMRRETGKLSEGAPRKWRLRREQTKSGAFAGKTVVVVGAKHELEPTCKWLLAGGVEEIMHEFRLGARIDFAVIMDNKKNDRITRLLKDSNIKCVDKSYIPDYLCNPDQTDIKDHLV